MKSAVLLLLLSVPRAWAASALEPVYEQLPEPAARDVAKGEDDLRLTVAGRRLLVEAQEVERRSALDGLSGLEAVRLMRIPKPTLVFDVKRLPKITPAEFELAFARELSKAAMNIPLELAETEMAARQQELAFALDKAEQDAVFAKKLREAVKAQQKRLEGYSENDPVLYPPPTPVGELDRAAYYVALFVVSPERFYWAVERDVSWTQGMVRLTELEDFMDRHASDLAQARPAPGTPYAWVAGRRYPARLVAAAKPFLELGGLARTREALGQFDRAPAFDLRARLEQWLSR